MSNYLEDKDLEFLKNCPNEDLKALADLLVFDKDGKKHWNEKLSEKKSYLEGYPNNLKNAVNDIILELQCYGADTIASAVREIIGKHPGVPYREILMDVCDKKKVSYNKASSTERIEFHLIQYIIEETLQKVSDEDILAIADELGVSITGEENRDQITDKILQKSTSPTLYSKMTEIVSSAVVPGSIAGVAGAAALVASRVGLPRLVGLAIPAINAFMWGWLIKDLSGPAYRITVPAVIMIINFRQKCLV
jgi:uncharacterized protein YaaW (UPF0174 family)